MKGCSSRKPLVELLILPSDDLLYKLRLLTRCHACARRHPSHDQISWLLLPCLRSEDRSPAICIAISREASWKLICTRPKSLSQSAPETRSCRLHGYTYPRNPRWLYAKPSSPQTPCLATQHTEGILHIALASARLQTIAHSVHRSSRGAPLPTFINLRVSVAISLFLLPFDLGPVRPHALPHVKRRGAFMVKAPRSQNVNLRNCLGACLAIACLLRLCLTYRSLADSTAVQLQIDSLFLQPVRSYEPEPQSISIFTDEVRLV